MNFPSTSLTIEAAIVDNHYLIKWSVSKPAGAGWSGEQSGELILSSAEKLEQWFKHQAGRFV